MIIWILQTGEPLHCDIGTPRPMRAMNLANVLVSRGHEVVLWSSAFFHQEKRQRCREFQTISINERLTINLVPSRGYSRNIGPGRLLDHAELAINLFKVLNTGQHALPDVAFIGFPPIETAAVMSRWLKVRGVPTMVDAKDQWPTIFVEPLPKWLRPVGKIALLPYFYYAKRTFNDADAFCAMSDGFIEWMCELACRSRRAVDLAVPLTTPRPDVDANSLEIARSWWAKLGVSSGTNRRVCFVGSLSPSFDFSIVRSLAERCINEGIECQFVICGDGGAAQDIRRLMAGLSNVLMPGWIDAPKIAALASCSAASIAPYINNDAFMRSVPNKILDSLANGLPILTTLRGTVEKLVNGEQLGFCGESPGDIFDFLCVLLNDDGFRSKMSQRALSVYEDRFSIDKVYGNLADGLERISSK